jgi:hypothetical protein
MPNGKPNFNLEECEKFFAPIAATIERFVARRNLELIKYAHHQPNWALAFAHPIGIGGFGHIRLSKSAVDTLEISADVWVDLYDSFTRRLRRLEPAPAPMDDASLTARMDATLDEVLSWQLDDQFATHGGYEQGWSSIPKKVFYSMPKWPKPVRDRNGM